MRSNCRSLWRLAEVAAGQGAGWNYGWTAVPSTGVTPFDSNQSFRSAYSANPQVGLRPFLPFERLSQTARSIWSASARTLRVGSRHTECSVLGLNPHTGGILAWRYPEMTAIVTAEL